MILPKIEQPLKTARVIENEDTDQSCEWDDIEDFHQSDGDEEKLNTTQDVIVFRNKGNNSGCEESSDHNDSSGIDDEDHYEDSDADVSSDGEDNNEDANSGLANVMRSILNSNKNVNKGRVILAKARKDGDRKEADSDSDDFQVVKDGKIVKKLKKDVKEKEQDKPVKRVSQREKDIKRKEWENLFRIKPDCVTDRDKERKFRVLATQGVVQLFSAFEKHHKDIKKKMSETQSVIQREKILSQTGKESFLDILWSEGKKTNSSEQECKEEIKDEDKAMPASNLSRWKVLSDQYYKDPKLDSWNNMDSD